jgi:hypothetical protein
MGEFDGLQLVGEESHDELQFVKPGEVQRDAREFFGIQEKDDQYDPALVNVDTVKTLDLKPDAEAKAYENSKKSGHPISVTRDHPSHYEEDLDDWQHLSREAKRHISKSPNHVASSRGDFKNLNFLDSVIKGAPEAFELGQRNMDIADLRWRQLMGDESPEIDKSIMDLKARQRPLPEGAGFFGRGVIGAGEQLPLLWRTLKGGGGGGVIGAGIGAATALIFGQLGPQVATPEEAVTVPAFTRKGYMIGSRAGSAMAIFKVEASLAYDEFLDIRDENGQPIDRDILKMGAYAVGAANSGLEMLGLGAILKTVPGGERILGRMTSAQIKKLLLRKTVRDKLFDLSKKYAGAISTETITEIAQEAVNIFVGEIVKDVSETKEGTFFRPFVSRDAGDRLFEIGKRTIETTTILAGVPTVASMSTTLAMGETSQRWINKQDEINQAVNQSLTKERVPDYMEEILDEYGQGGEAFITDTGINTMYQTDPEVATAILNKLEVDIDEARRNASMGLETSVKLSKVQAQLTPEEFNLIKGDIKESISSFSDNQIKDGTVARELDRLRLIWEEELKDEEEVVVEKERIRGELEAAGFDKEVVEKFPTILTGLANRFAREGISRSEFLNKIKFEQTTFEKFKKFIGIKPKLEDIPFQTAIGVVDNSAVWDYQNTVPEKIIHEDWDKGNSPRFDLEGVGDILREYAKTKPDLGYINEKLRRINRTLNRLETTGKLHPDDHINAARNLEGNPLERLREAYVNQPTISKPQEATRQLILSYIDGKYEEVRKWHDVIKKESWDKVSITPNEVKALFQADEDIKKAAITPIRERKGQIFEEKHLISLFEGRDFSSLVHEAGHLFMLEMTAIVESGTASEQLISDMNTIRDWLGMKEGEEITNEQQEKFARGFELYFWEGKSPNAELESVFARFKAWMRKIYARAVDLNVKLNAGVRDIFDRMISANNEIQAVARLSGITSLTTEHMNELGILKEDQKFLKELIDKALIKGEENLIKARNKGIKENREKWTKEAESEVRKEDIRNVYKAIDIIKERTLYNKVTKQTEKVQLNRKEFIERYGEENIKKLPATGLLINDGMSLGDAALEYGFEDADTMIYAFFDTRPMEEVIKERVEAKQAAHDNQFIAEDYLSDTKEYEDYMVVIGKHLSDIQEKRFIKRVSTTRQVKKGEIVKRKVPLSLKSITRSAIKRQAKEIMDSTPVKDGRRVYKYLNNMKKAYTELQRAINRKDWTAALRSNEKMRLSYELAGLATKTRKLEQSTLKKAKRSGKSKTVNIKYREAIRDLNNKFNLSELTPDEPDRLVPLHKLLAGSEVSESISMPLFLQISNVVNDYRDLTVSQIQELNDIISYLAKTGRDIQKGLLSDGVTLIKDMVDIAVSAMDKITPKKVRDRFAIFSKLSDAHKSFFAKLDGLPFIIKALGGYVSVKGKIVKSQLERMIIDPLKDAQEKRTIIFDKSMEGVSPYSSHIGNRIRDLRKEHGNKIIIKDLNVPMILQNYGKQVGYITPEQVFAIALNMGNEQNQLALFNGFEGFSKTDLDLILGILTIKDMDAVQGIWNEMEKLFPETNAVHKRLNNFAMKKVEAREFKFKGKTYRGGYYPLQYDRELSERVAQIKEVDDFFSSQDAKFASPYAASGHTLARVSGVSLPVDLSLSIIPRHFAKAVQYIAYAEVIRDVNRITSNNEFADAAIRALGRDVYREIKPALKHIANPRVPGLDVPGGRVISYMRGVATAWNLAWNVSVALKQPFSTFSAIHDMGLGGRSGLRAYMKGMQAVMSSPMVHFNSMMEMSKYMKDRMRSFDRDYRSEFFKMSGLQKELAFGDKSITWQQVVNWGYMPIRMTDMAAVLPIWWGSYHEMLNENSTNEKEAIRYADDIVRDTQPSAQALDLSAWFREGGFFGMFNLHQTFTVGKYGQRQRLYYRAWKNKSISTADYAWFNLVDAFLPIISIHIMIALMKGQDLEDDETARDILKDTVKSWMFMGVPLVNPLIDSVTNLYRDPIDVPGERQINTIVNAMRGIKRGVEKGHFTDKEKERIFWDVAHTISAASKVPITKVIQRAAKGETPREKLFGKKRK